MGGSSFSSATYADLSQNYQRKSTQQIFQQTAKGTMHKDMNPKGIEFRESRDSAAHANSIPIIVALDETGSMGSIPKELIQNKLSKLMQTLIDNGVEDASVCFVGIGDHYSDHSPLQIGQFESGVDELNHWMTSIELEGNGGGNGGESYHLAWLFGARHTTTDSFEKRGIKGFLFTIGDEWVHGKVEAQWLKDYMGYSEASDISKEILLEEARKSYHVFHINVEHGFDRGDKNKWKALMEENVITITDPDIVAETIATTVAVISGADLATVTKSFDSATGGKVGTALALITSNLSKQSDSGIAQTGIVEL